MFKLVWIDIFTQKAACRPPLSALCPLHEVHLGGPAVLISRVSLLFHCVNVSSPLCTKGLPQYMPLCLSP